MDEEDYRPYVNHIVDIEVNGGRTHVLCGIAITWTNPKPIQPDVWCEKCVELDG